MPNRRNKLLKRRKHKGKRELARKAATIPERRRVLIVCEGEKTEPIYFRAVRARLRLTTADVRVDDEGDSAPISVFRYGKQEFERDGEFDAIFFVFDRDTHPTYGDALRLIEEFRKTRACKGKIVEAITSVPCFEIWFILHFEAIRRPFSQSGGRSPCENVIRELRKRPGFTNYKKGNRDVFELLYGRLDDAKSHASLTLRDSQSTGESLHYGNPTTRVHILVQKLEEIARENKQ